MKIMFVCTGNICRSAMAHWLMKKKIEDKKIKNIEVYSCGVFAYPEDMPTDAAIEVMEEYGVDLKKHRATQIQSSKIEKMDLILCMTYSQKYSVCQMYPELKDKVYTLKEYVKFDEKDPSNIDISDPWGYEIQVYRLCAAIIDNCIDKLIPTIQK